MVKRDMIMQLLILCQMKVSQKHVNLKYLGLSDTISPRESLGPNCQAMKSCLPQLHVTIGNNLYVVVHTASDYILLEQLQYDFITSFSLGNITVCVYIVNVDTIQGPLFVFKNYGFAGEDKNTLFC